MTTRARYLGAKGVVVDGFVRDLEEHQDFPVFARGSSCLGAATFTRACSIQTPITINSSFRYPSIIIQSGDVVIGDRDGVVVVPQHLIEKVVEICQISVEVDSQIMSDLQSGISVEESMKRRR